MRSLREDIVCIQSIQIFLDNAESNICIIEKDVSELECFVNKYDVRSVVSNMMDLPIMLEYLEKNTKVKWDKLYPDSNLNDQTEHQLKYSCDGPKIPDSTRKYQVTIIIAITEISDYNKTMANKLIQNLDIS